MISDNAKDPSRSKQKPEWQPLIATRMAAQTAGKIAAKIAAKVAAKLEPKWPPKLEPKWEPKPKPKREPKPEPKLELKPKPKLAKPGPKLEQTKINSRGQKKLADPNRYNLQ